jgi:hypothetical protein
LAFSFSTFWWGEDVPVVLGADGHTGALGRTARAALGNGVADLPQVGRDLLFLPPARIVVPRMGAADLHAGVALALVFLELVVGNGLVTGALLRRLLRTVLFRRHDDLPARRRCKAQTCTPVQRARAGAA